MNDLSVKARRFLEKENAGEYIEAVVKFYEKGYSPDKMYKLLELLEKCAKEFS